MVKNIEKNMSAIDSCINRLTRGTIISTFATSKETAVQVERLGNVAESINADTSKIKAETKDIKGDTSEIRTSVHLIETTMNEQHKSSEKAISHIVDLLDEQMRNSECKPKPPQPNYIRLVHTLLTGERE